MTHPVKGVDHVYLLINDLDKGLAQYQALGFTLSPRGMHSAAKGSANHTIMFPEDYFELLGIINPTPGNESRRALLESAGEGLHAIACRIGSAQEAAEALAGLGIATEGLGDFERPVPLPGGGTGVAAFSTVSFTPEETPLGTVFMCQHKTRETVWIPDLLEHANTACGLGGVVAVSDSPAEDAARFARLFADGSVRTIPGGAEVVTGARSIPILLLDAAAVAALYPGVDLSQTPKGAFTALRIKVADMARARACLAEAGIAPIATGAGLAVPPAQTSGTILEFIPA